MDMIKQIRPLHIKTDMTNLKNKKCVPCEGGVPPLTEKEITIYLKELSAGWEVIDSKKIRKDFRFVNYKATMSFVNNVAAIADEENHHPDMCVHYSNVEMEIHTHAIDGLSENDFILAAKIDDI